MSVRFRSVISALAALLLPAIVAAQVQVRGAPGTAVSNGAGSSAFHRRASSSGGSDSSQVAIIGGVVGGVILALTALLVGWHIQKQHDQRQDAESRFFYVGEEQGPTLNPYNEFATASMKNAAVKAREAATPLLHVIVPGPAITVDHPSNFTNSPSPSEAAEKETGGPESATPLLQVSATTPSTPGHSSFSSCLSSPSDEASATNASTLAPLGEEKESSRISYGTVKRPRRPLSATEDLFGSPVWDDKVIMTYPPPGSPVRHSRGETMDFTSGALVSSGSCKSSANSSPRRPLPPPPGPPDLSVAPPPHNPEKLGLHDRRERPVSMPPVYDPQWREELEAAEAARREAEQNAGGAAAA